MVDYEYCNQKKSWTTIILIARSKYTNLPDAGQQSYSSRVAVNDTMTAGLSCETR